MYYRTTKRSFTEVEQDKMWQLWSQGLSLSEIGRSINKHAASVFAFLQKWGGIQPAKPKRSSKHLSLTEREEISRGLSAQLSIREIARRLNRSASTISREVSRNGGRLKYRAVSADKSAWFHARRPKSCKLASNARLNKLVSDKLLIKWSPEQISGWLKRIYPLQTDMHISHETIYRTLYVQARGALKKELLSQLRTRRVMRQSKKFNTKGNTRGGIIDAISIHERPTEVDSREIPGHWEGDLICGANKSYIATLVERSSRFTMLVKLEANDSPTVINGIKTKIIDLPDELKKSLTWDRGMELARHKNLSVDTNIQVYFCDPQSPWQRGTNENTNKLLRQYMPKQTDLSVYSQDQLDIIARELNERPRKTLNFMSPADKIQEVLL